MITRSMALCRLNENSVIKMDPNIEIQMWTQEKTTNGSKSTSDSDDRTKIASMDKTKNDLNDKAKNDRKRRRHSERDNDNSKKSKHRSENKDTEERNETGNNVTSYIGDIFKIFLPTDDNQSVTTEYEQVDLASKYDETEMSVSSRHCRLNRIPAASTVKVEAINSDIQVERNRTNARHHRKTKTTQALNEVAANVASTSDGRYSTTLKDNSKLDSKKFHEVSHKNTRRSHTGKKNITDGRNSPLLIERPGKALVKEHRKGFQKLSDQCRVEINKTIASINNLCTEEIDENSCSRDRSTVEIDKSIESLNINDPSTSNFNKNSCSYDQSMFEIDKNSLNSGSCHTSDQFQVERHRTHNNYRKSNNRKKNKDQQNHKLKKIVSLETNTDLNNKNAPSSTRCQRLYRNPYLNFYVPLLRNQCRHLPASRVAQYAGSKWNAMQQAQKQKYRDMAAQAVKQKPVRKLRGMKQTRGGGRTQRVVKRNGGG